ncbi:hypothetical protein A2U01_0111885, partial [Trifolium medium]|nr:hypothetical protein [Trifolium medium]
NRSCQGTGFGVPKKRLSGNQSIQEDE